MQRISKAAAVFALGLAVSVVATPSFAQRSEMTDARAQALRTCNKEADKMKQYTWGVQQLAKYRTCMMEHHQEV